MSKDLTEVAVDHLPVCDICAQEGSKTRASYDAKMVLGPWAYLCERHFKSHTNGKLGTGIGQKLVKK